MATVVFPSAKQIRDFKFKDISNGSNLMTLLEVLNSANFIGKFIESSKLKREILTSIEPHRLTAEQFS